MLEQTQLPRFASALRRAIRDRELEASGRAELRFHYDADVVVGMVMGFLQFNDSTTRPDNRNLLVRALLSSGYLGELHVLRPHALEVDQQMRQLPNMATAAAGSAFRGRVLEFLKSWGADQDMERLDSILRTAPEDERITRFFNYLQELGPTTFIAVELVRGTWQQRLKHLWENQLLHFDGAGEPMGSLAEDPLVWFINSVITGERREMSLSNLRDAAALAVLARRIQERQEGRDVPLVRFYTETSVLRRAWRKSADLRRVLSYTDPELAGGVEGFEYPAEDGFVGCTPEYFILRASFEELRFPGVEVRDPDRPPLVSLDELRYVCRELGALRDRSGAEVSRLAQSLSLGGEPLSTTLRELESLSFLRNIWSRFQIPRSLREISPRWNEVWSFAQEQTESGALEAEIEGVRLELRDKVEGMRRWYDDLREIEGAVDRYRRLARRVPESVPDPLRDLGLVRWGMPLPAAELDRVREMVGAMLSPEPREAARGCSLLASRIEHVDGDAACAAVCGVLWWLHQWDLLVRVIDEHLAREPVHSPYLRVIRAAAQFQGSPRLRRAEKEALIHELRDLERGVQGSARAGLLLGLGYVLFHAWLSERMSPLDELRFRRTGEVPFDPLTARWAHESFSAGREAYALFPPDSLEQAFAVNHCAYVGTVTGVDPDSTREFVSRLTALRAKPEVWHYRFTDTLAYHELFSALRYWRGVKEEGRVSLSDARPEVCEQLRHAEALLDGVEDDFADPVIPQHREELRQVMQDLQCSLAVPADAESLASAGA